jgi:hypothetical protein
MWRLENMCMSEAGAYVHTQSMWACKDRKMLECWGERNPKDNLTYHHQPWIRCTFPSHCSVGHCSRRCEKVLHCECPFSVPSTKNFRLLTTFSTWLADGERAKGSAPSRRIIPFWSIGNSSVRTHQRTSCIRTCMTFLIFYRTDSRNPCTLKELKWSGTTGVAMAVRICSNYQLELVNLTENFPRNRWPALLCLLACRRHARTRKRGPSRLWQCWASAGKVICPEKFVRSLALSKY